MGIKNLGKFIRKKYPECVREVSLQHYQNQRAVIDTPIFMYRFCSVNPDTCIQMFKRQLQQFEHWNIVPTYVFDGVPAATSARTTSTGKDLKEGTLEERRKRKREWKDKANDESLPVADRLVYQTRLQNIPTRQHYAELQTFLTSCNVTFLTAESDAEKECVARGLQGKADVVFSEDFDVLPFGWNLSTGLGRKKMLEYDLKQIQNAMGFTHEMFVEFCILCGCDFSPSIGNVGPVRALKLLQVHKNIDTLLTFLDRNKYTVPDPFPYHDARNAFQALDSTAPSEGTSEGTLSDSSNSINKASVCFFEFL